MCTARPRSAGIAHLCDAVPHDPQRPSLDEWPQITGRHAQHVGGPGRAVVRPVKKVLQQLLLVLMWAHPPVGMWCIGTVLLLFPLRACHNACQAQCIAKLLHYLLRCPYEHVVIGDAELHVHLGAANMAITAHRPLLPTKQVWPNPPPAELVQGWPLVPQWTV